jgi:transaldolase
MSPPWRGSDIQTNPPATNAAVQKLAGKTFSRQVDRMPPDAVLREIDQKVDFERMEDVLMEEGLKKFADPQRVLLKLIRDKRSEFAVTGG